MKSYGSGSIVPALAKSARTGHPQFRNGKGKQWLKGWATRLEKNGDTFRSPAGDHTVTLSEKFTQDSPSKDSNIKIANPPTSQKHNTYEDVQGVKKGRDFSVERHWMIDNKPARIFYEGTKDASGRPASASSEILKLSYDNGFILTRRNDP